ncbi:MAG: hypothetical protein ACFFGP_08535 [Promethearchaeota archaeon]
MLDTSFDFIRPEFLSAIFFHQKSVVVFPYVDIKHLRSLEIFAIGYNIVDLDSTALYNLREIIELERYNSYSQSPSFFFITNVSKTQLDEIIKLKDLHCIINCNEDLALNSYSDKNHFIFFNKKNKKFINYSPKDLSFEVSLISSSKNISSLQDKILKIKTLATNIYTELNDSGNVQRIANLLNEYEPRYWNKILDYTGLYYAIEIPEISSESSSTKIVKELSTSPFSEEYDLIVSKNKMIGKEFIQLIHDYREKKVNAANLDTGQLFYPLNLYDYLRTHHWKDGIDKQFLNDWVKMNKTQYILKKDDLADFHTILFKLNLPDEIISKVLNIENQDKEVKNEEINTKVVDKELSLPIMPQTQKSMLEKLNDIENIIENNLPDYEIEYLLKEITKLQRIMKIKNAIPPKKQHSLAEMLITLNLNQIQSENVRKILMTAEKQFNFYKDNPKLDASPIIAQYSKALEVMLNEKISSHFKPLFAQYRKKYQNNETSEDFNKKFGNLMRNKSLNLGIWIAILEDLDQPQKPSDVREFLSILSEKFENTSLHAIEIACKTINPLRNEYIHTEVCSLEEVCNARQKIVNVLNPVIELLY